MVRINIPRNFTHRTVLIHVRRVNDAVAEAGCFDEITDFCGAFRDP
jgi:hypothetical protein